MAPASILSVRTVICVACGDAERLIVVTPGGTVSRCYVCGDVEVRPTVHVTVRGGYHPDRVRVREGRSVVLVFDHQESGDCTAKVVFADLSVSADRPDLAEATLRLPPLAPGEYGFACGMDMIHGVLVAEAAPA